MTLRELIGILLESPFYLEMTPGERLEMLERYRAEGVVLRQAKNP